VDIICQICNREGHPAKHCWYCFSDADDDVFDDKEAHVASYGVDTNWYSDTGATNHITGELNNLTMRDTYRGNDKVNTASGQGMSISHIGHSTVHTQAQKFLLNNVLHVPNATKNLLSVHRFTYDNVCSSSFIPSSF
jgi:histone deacetylase 1/2